MGIDLSASFPSMGPAAENQMNPAGRARQTAGSALSWKAAQRARREPRRENLRYRKLITSTRELTRPTAEAKQPGRRNPCFLCIGLYEDTAIVVKGETLRVIGRGAVNLVDAVGAAQPNRGATMSSQRRS